MSDIPTPWIHTPPGFNGYWFEFNGQRYEGPGKSKHRDTVADAKNHALRVIYFSGIIKFPFIKASKETGEYEFFLRDVKVTGKTNPAYRAWMAAMFHLYSIYPFKPEQLEKIKAACGTEPEDKTRTHI